MGVTFRSHVLRNGLRIIAEVDPDAHSSACGFFVWTGARDERHELMGVSHFLEHMMFKGTEDISAEDLNRRFDEIGARNNAYTSGELTCFHAHVLPERLTEATDLLARMMRPALRVDDFDREKGVILEEIAMYKDEPYWVLYEELVERHYGGQGGGQGGHGLGHRVLGTAESITALQRDAMLGYFTDRYSADNTIASFAGRMDFDAIVAQLNELCGSWQSTRAGRDRARPKVGAGEFTLKKDNVTRAYIAGLAPAPAFDDERRYAAMLLSQVLGAADNSRLHWALIETGLAEEAQAGYDPHDGAGEFVVYASGDPERAEEIWSTVRAQVEGLSESLTDDDLERLRSKLATAVTVGAERPADGMQRIGRTWLYLNRYSTLDEELERINRVTVGDLRAVAAAFPVMPVTVGKLLPGG